MRNILLAIFVTFILYAGLYAYDNKHVWFQPSFIPMFADNENNFQVDRFYDNEFKVVCYSQSNAVNYEVAAISCVKN